MGLHIEDLERVNYGFVLDMMIESGNDQCNYKEMASQDDFDRF